MNDQSPNDIFHASSFMQGHNAEYLEQLYAQYVKDPSAVDAAWHAFFAELGDDARDVTAEAAGPSWARGDWPPMPDGDRVHALDGQWPEAPEAEGKAAAKKIEAKAAEKGVSLSDDQVKRAVLDSIRALMLIRAYRIRGHLVADLDPLGMQKRTPHPELDPASDGFTDADMDRPIFIDNVLGLEVASIRQILDIVKRTYCGTFALQYMHISNPEEAGWLKERIEGFDKEIRFTQEGRKAILNKLVEAEGFEKFLHVKYMGTKRFGLDGGESLIPAMEQIIKRGGQLGLREIIEAFVKFREEVITRRTKFELNKARDRAHILLGLVVAVTNLDKVVKIIRGSASPAEARETLLAKQWPIGEIAPYLRLVEAIENDIEGDSYRLSDIQVRAILDLRLHRLTALGRDEIGKELAELADAITEYLAILADRVKLYGVMRDEFEAIEREFATPRLSEITAAADGIEDEDLIEREDMVVTVTMQGYIKRTPLDTFRAQARGGKGRSGMATKDEDAVTELFVTSTHTPVLFFSTAGKVYRLKVWRLPEGGPATRGRPMVNLLPLGPGETISTVLPLPEDEAEWSKLHVMFATAKGSVRRNSMDAFANVPSNGKIAMKFEGEDEDDRLIGVALLDESDDVLLATRQGKAIRFQADDVREFQSRNSTGVRGMRLADGDAVISLSVLHRSGADGEQREEYLRYAPWKPEKDGEMQDREMFARMQDAEQFILTVCANGYGKLSSAYEYRRTGRGGQGITNIDNIGRNGPVVASFPATRADQLMLVTDQAKLIRMGLDSLRVIGRNSAGVRLFNVAEDEHVVSAAKIEESEADAVVDGEADSSEA